jgi:hypothetical protein
MTPENPYGNWVEVFVTALSAVAAIGAAKMTPPKASFDVGHAPKTLVLVPHPDNELLTGGLSLRLLRECGFAVIDVAVTLGSLVERRSSPWHELQAACAYFGFGLAETRQRPSLISDLRAFLNPPRSRTDWRATTDMRRRA